MGSFIVLYKSYNTDKSSSPNLADKLFPREQYMSSRTIHLTQAVEQESPTAFNLGATFSTGYKMQTVTV